MFFVHKGTQLTDGLANYEYLQAKSFKEHLSVPEIAALHYPLTRW